MALITRGDEQQRFFEHRCATVSDPSPEMLTTTVKIADLLFYLVVVHSPLYNEFDFISTYIICASILYTAHEKTNFPRYMKGQATAPIRCIDNRTRVTRYKKDRHNMITARVRVSSLKATR